MASSSTITLDDLAPSTPPPDGHLFYPAHEDNVTTTEQGTSPPRVFSKLGKITKLDWLFHKTGLLKGKPRGYAFLEYANKDDSLRALSAAHGKPLRGRTLVVTFAHQAPLDQYSGTGTPASLRNRKTMMDVGRPTTLSMLKTGMDTRHEGKMQDKIAMMEAKLRQMGRTNPRPVPPSTPSDRSTSTPSSTPPLPAPYLPTHPSLPQNPHPRSPAHSPQSRLPHCHHRPFPHLSLVFSAVPRPRPLLLLSCRRLCHRGWDARWDSASLSSLGGTSSGAPRAAAKASKLVGVKIKPKEKDKDKGQDKFKDNGSGKS